MKKIKLPAGNFFYTKFAHMLKIENQPFTKQKCICDFSFHMEHVHDLPTENQKNRSRINQMKCMHPIYLSIQLKNYLMVIWLFAEIL